MSDAEKVIEAFNNKIIENVNNLTKKHIFNITLIFFAIIFSLLILYK